MLAVKCCCAVVSVCVGIKQFVQLHVISRHAALLLDVGMRIM